MVPTPLDLFRQVIYEKVGGWLDIGNHFRRPYRPVVPSPILEYQPDRSNCDQEYEEFLVAAMAMYSKLPDDWAKQFSAEVDKGVRKDVLYDRICQDVGRI